MIIKVVDFEILSRHLKKYQDGLNEIGEVKRKFVDRLTPFKKEMESIITAANSGIVLDEESEKKRVDRFQEIQNTAVEVDGEFKQEMRSMNDELSKSVYAELSEIITKWSVDKNIDMVIGSTEVVFLKEEHFATNDILEILKEKDMFIDNYLHEGLEKQF
jgi:Skp family chaperone for outer membrane proteins